MWNFDFQASGGKRLRGKGWLGLLGLVLHTTRWPTAALVAAPYLKALLKAAWGLL